MTLEEFMRILDAARFDLDLSDGMRERAKDYYPRLQRLISAMREEGLID